MEKNNFNRGYAPRQNNETNAPQVEAQVENPGFIESHKKTLVIGGVITVGTALAAWLTTKLTRRIKAKRAAVAAQENKPAEEPSTEGKK